MFLSLACKSYTEFQPRVNIRIISIKPTWRLSLCTKTVKQVGDASLVIKYLNLMEEGNSSLRPPQMVHGVHLYPQKAPIQGGPQGHQGEAVLHLHQNSVLWDVPLMAMKVKPACFSGVITHCFHGRDEYYLLNKLIIGSSATCTSYLNPHAEPL